MDGNRNTHEDEDQDQSAMSPIDLNVLNLLRDTKAFCDVTIVIESQEFQAHKVNSKCKVKSYHWNIWLSKVILTSCSPYFYTMFLSDFGERDKSRVELKGLDVSSFEVIMKFIYTGELEISIENAQSLIMVNYGLQ